MRRWYFDAHMPLTLEISNLHSGEPGPYLPLLHHSVCFITDLPLYYDARFFSVIECEITGQRSSCLTFAQNPYRIAWALPRRVIPFLQCLGERCDRINRNAH